MKYSKTVALKDGRACIIRNGTAEDGEALLELFIAVHAQTDYLLTSSSYVHKGSFHYYTSGRRIRQRSDFAARTDRLTDGRIKYKVNKDTE